MSQPTHLGHGVPETDASLGPAFVAAAVVLAALLASLSPVAAAAVAGALVTVAAGAVRRALHDRDRRGGRRRRGVAPGRRTAAR